MTNAELDAKIIEFDAGEGSRVLRAVHEFLGRFVCYPSSHARVAHTLWCAHTHCLEQWHSSPRLAFMSEEKESGKTRALEVSALLTPGALLSFNLSPAALVRKVAEGGATILFDEIDALFGSTKREEGNLDVRSILNSGYKRGAKAYRCTTHGKKVEVEELDSFAPVAMGGLRNLPDTVASRAIIIRMRRRAPDEAVEQFRHRRVEPIAAPIYERLAAWCQTLNVGDAEPEMPEGVVDRAAECWEPLLALADAAGGVWPKLARAAAVHFVKGGRDEATSPGVELLEHIHEALGDSGAISTETLLKRLHERPESPWKDVHGKPLNDRGLAQRLKGYGIKSKQVRIGEVTLKGYARESFADAWKRYLPHLEGKQGKHGKHASDCNDLNVSDVSHVSLRDGPAVAPSPNGSATATVCAHCRNPGTDDDPLLEAAVAGQSAKLHGNCIGAFGSTADDDDGIPPFLRRTPA